MLTQFTKQYICLTHCSPYMISTLSIKNFGPIRNVDLELKNVNVFIGPQSSGKSVLAKLFTILKAPRKFFYKRDLEGKIYPEKKVEYEEFIQVLHQYNIDAFIEENTEILFNSELHRLEYKNRQLSYIPKLIQKVADLQNFSLDFTKNRKKIISKLKKIYPNLIRFQLRANRILNGESAPFTRGLKFENLDEEKFDDLIKSLEEIEEDLSTNTSLYIPAERNFINLIKKFALNFQLQKVPIPQYILTFGAENEKVQAKRIDLDFIQKGVFYKIINGEDKIFIDENKSILLSEAASGIQSVVPLIAILSNIQQFPNHRSFVIEEPELNLFPTAQYELIKYLESIRFLGLPEWEDLGTIHTYTTHSPYILSGINNLLYAFKARNKLTADYLFQTNEKINEKIIDKLQDIVKPVTDIINASINPDIFTAYQICNGHATSIFNKENGLIEENYIDNASDKINEDFESLMELLK